MEKHELEARIREYLESHHTISLATAAENVPHAATVFYVNIGWSLYFLSSPSSRHGTHLTMSPRVSGTINEDYDQWTEIKGIQLEGRVECLGSIFENGTIAGAYVAKFPNVSPFLTSPLKLGTDILKKIKNVRFYKIIPEKIRFIDNALGFGSREELFLQDTDR